MNRAPVHAGLKGPQGSGFRVLGAGGFGVLGSGFQGPPIQHGRSEGLDRGGDHAEGMIVVGVWDARRCEPARGQCRAVSRRMLATHGASWADRDPAFGSLTKLTHSLTPTSMHMHRQAEWAAQPSDRLAHARQLAASDCRWHSTFWTWGYTRDKIRGIRGIRVKNPILCSPSQTGLWAGPESARMLAESAHRTTDTSVSLCQAEP